jgi:hypothetical protein
MSADGVTPPVIRMMIFELIVAASFLSHLPFIVTIFHAWEIIPVLYSSSTCGKCICFRKLYDPNDVDIHSVTR